MRGCTECFSLEAEVPPGGQCHVRCPLPSLWVLAWNAACSGCYLLNKEHAESEEL